MWQATFNGLLSRAPEFNRSAKGVEDKRGVRVTCQRPFNSFDSLPRDCTLKMSRCLMRPTRDNSHQREKNCLNGDKILLWRGRSQYFPRYRSIGSGPVTFGIEKEGKVWTVSAAMPRHRAHRPPPSLRCPHCQGSARALICREQNVAVK